MIRDPKAHWTQVARSIRKRKGSSFLAGESDPYHAYKRKKMLKHFLERVSFAERTVLEVGCGPGGNLRLIAERFSPRRLIGVDISEEMLEIARERLVGYHNVELQETDSGHLNLPDRVADVSFTVTVLQHIADDDVFKRLVAEICRVTREEIVLIEDMPIAPAAGGADRHSPDRYRREVTQHGFRIEGMESLRLKLSRWGYWHIRRLLTREFHERGDPQRVAAIALMHAWIGVSRWGDWCFDDEGDLTKLVFRRA